MGFIDYRIESTISKQCGRVILHVGLVFNQNFRQRNEEHKVCQLIVVDRSLERISLWLWDSQIEQFPWTLQNPIALCTAVLVEVKDNLIRLHAKQASHVYYDASYYPQPTMLKQWFDKNRVSLSFEKLPFLSQDFAENDASGISIEEHVCTLLKSLTSSASPLALASFEEPHPFLQSSNKSSQAREVKRARNICFTRARNAEIRDRINRLKRDVKGNFLCYECNRRMPSAFVSSKSILKCRFCAMSTNTFAQKKLKRENASIWRLMTSLLAHPCRDIVSIIFRSHLEGLFKSSRSLSLRRCLYRVDSTSQQMRSAIALLLLERNVSTSLLLQSWLHFQCVVDDPSLLPSTYGSRSRNLAISWSLDHSLAQIHFSLDIRICVFIHLITSLCPLSLSFNSFKSDHIVSGKIFYQSVKFAAAVIFWIIISVRPCSDLLNLSGMTGVVAALVSLDNSHSSDSSLPSHSNSDTLNVGPSVCHQIIPLSIRESLSIPASVRELIAPYPPPGGLTRDDIQFISDLGLPTGWASEHWHKQRCVPFVGRVAMALAASFAEAIASCSASSSPVALSPASSRAHQEFVLTIPEVLFDDSASMAEYIRSHPPAASVQAALEEISVPLSSILSELLGSLDTSVHKWIPEALVYLRNFVGNTRVDVGTQAFLLRLKPWIQTHFVPKAPDLNSRIRDRISACQVAAFNMRLPTIPSERESASSSASVLSSPVKKLKAERRLSEPSKGDFFSRESGSGSSSNVSSVSSDVRMHTACPDAESESSSPFFAKQQTSNSRVRLSAIEHSADSDTILSAESSSHADSSYRPGSNSECTSASTYASASASCSATNSASASCPPRSQRDPPRTRTPMRQLRLDQFVNLDACLNNQSQNSCSIVARAPLRNKTQTIKPVIPTKEASCGLHPTTPKTRTKTPYKCDICGKIFDERRRLNAHMFSHSDSRIACTLCKPPLGIDAESWKRPTYNNPKSLRKHMKIHENPDAFTCQLCVPPPGIEVESWKRPSFQSSSGHSRHMQWHQNPNGFSCELCVPPPGDAAESWTRPNYQTARSLKRHMLARHPSQNKEE